MYKGQHATPGKEDGAVPTLVVDTLSYSDLDLLAHDILQELGGRARRLCWWSWCLNGVGHAGR